MSESALDIGKFYERLDAKRLSMNLSWRELAASIEASPSTFSRLKEGRRPDVDTFAKLLAWLGESAEEFLHKVKKPETDVDRAVGNVTAHLKAGGSLSADVSDALRGVLQAAQKVLEDQEQLKAAMQLLQAKI